MPRLRLERHELFAQGIATGKSATQAYLDAGYRKNRGTPANASRLNKNELIRQRVTELRTQDARKTGITPEVIAQNLLEDRSLALQLGQPSAAVAADKALAELFGLITKKHQVSGKVDHEHTWTHEAALERLMQRGTLDLQPETVKRTQEVQQVQYVSSDEQRSAEPLCSPQTDTPHPPGGASGRPWGPIPPVEDDTAASPPEDMGFPVDLDDEDEDG